MLPQKHTGTAIMQFLFNLVWDHSRCRYLAAPAREEARS
jgi:hypothetical protein